MITNGWEEFRRENEIMLSERRRIKSELLDWVDDCKKEIACNEPQDNISRAKFIMLDKLIDKLNSI
jgi:hypothetical protein